MTVTQRPAGASGLPSVGSQSLMCFRFRLIFPLIDPFYPVAYGTVTLCITCVPSKQGNSILVLQYIITCSPKYGTYLKNSYYIYIELHYEHVN